MKFVWFPSENGFTVYYSCKLQIIQRQGKFKQAKIETIRKIVNKLKQSEKKQQQNSAAKKERYQNVLNQLKVRRKTPFGEVHC